MLTPPTPSESRCKRSAASIDAIASRCGIGSCPRLAWPVEHAGPRHPCTNSLRSGAICNAATIPICHCLKLSRAVSLSDPEVNTADLLVDPMLELLDRSLEVRLARHPLAERIDRLGGCFCGLFG